MSFKEFVYDYGFFFLMVFMILFSFVLFLNLAYNDYFSKEKCTVDGYVYDSFLGFGESCIFSVKEYEKDIFKGNNPERMEVQ